MFCVYLSGCCGSISRHSCTWKKKQIRFSRWLAGDLWRLSGEHVLTMILNPVACVPRYIILCFDSFIMGGILWLYQAQVVYLLAWDRRDQEQSRWLFLNSRAQKIKTLVFNLVNARCPPILSLTSPTNTLRWFQVFLYYLSVLFFILYFRRGLSYFINDLPPDVFPVVLRTINLLT